MYLEWKRLVVTYGVRGVKVHDAKLVAAMRVHQVGRILTFNTEHFLRYDVEVVHPTTVAT